MSILIIAEAGVNHNGDVKTAIKLIESAAIAGADIVKFQTFKPEALVSKFAQKAAYQKEVTSKNESQLEMIRRLTLPEVSYPLLVRCCEDNGVAFLSTPFDLESVDFLNGINQPFWKVPSGEITNLPLLIKMASTGKQVLLSSGMSTLEEIEAAVNILKGSGSGEVIVLHCTTEYPAPLEDVNLCAMDTIRQKLGLRVGYSDHTIGIEVAIAAAALGAVVIEKHFTLDKTMEGPDHKASLVPEELGAMIKSIRNVEVALGSKVKAPTASERKNMTVARKSVVASRCIKQGELLTQENITIKRPGCGVSPMRWFEVLGTKAIRDFEEDELIEL